MKFYINRWLAWMLLILPCMLSGCGGEKEEETAPTAYRVVWKIQITYQDGNEVARRSYEDQEQMQMVLNYLRWIDPYGVPAEDPMTQQGRDFFVELSYSDGSAKTYHQRCDRYLRAGDGPWKKIDPEHARELGRIMGILEEREYSTPGLESRKKETVLLS